VQTLLDEPDGSVTLVAMGPLTNIAHAFIKNPQAMCRAVQLIIMGGCTADMPAADMPSRKGNITSDAEFNFHMAAEDARIVMDSGLPVTLIPMNCTHQMTMTREREQAIRTALSENARAAEAVVGMMNAPRTLDLMKFNSAPVMHDVHTALYLLTPESYEGRRGMVTVTTQGREMGRTDFFPDAGSPVLVLEALKDADRLFNCVTKSLKRCIVP
jgi:purine nucleosidase